MAVNSDNYNSNDSTDTFDSIVETTERILNTPVLNSYCTYGELLSWTDIITHPVQYMTILVQIGYEPLPPKLTRTIFGRTQLQLPGFLTYMKYIAQTDGFFGIYRGLKYHYMYSLVHRFTAINTDRYQKEYRYPDLIDPEAKYRDVNILIRSITCDTMTKLTELTVAYPFRIMMVRCMAQFIGRETHYDSILNAISDIYNTGGLIGFYAGFIPYALGECAFIVIQQTLIFLLRDKFQEIGVQKSTSFLNGAVSMLARMIVYPFSLVSTVMSCNGVGCNSLVASAYTVPEYNDWLECWHTLHARGELGRGSSLWWRYQPITSSLMKPYPIIKPMGPVKPLPKQY